MPNETAKELAAFLESAAPIVNEAVETTAIPVAAAVVETPPIAPVDEVVSIPPTLPSIETMMTELLADLKRIGMSAKDLHYRSKGKPFYGIHLLADLIWEVAHEADDLVEVFFMGQLQKDPPLMEDVCRLAVDLKVWYVRNHNYFISGLNSICLKTMHDIEKIKKAYPEIYAGTHAVLDAISQKCLVAIGLLTKTQE